MDYGNLAALKAAIQARIKENGVGGKNRASDIEQSYDDVADTLFARNDEKTTQISDLETDVFDIGVDIGTLETEVESIKRPGEIAFTSAIPFTLPSAKTSVTVDQDYTLSLGAAPIADSYHILKTTGNRVNNLIIPSSWINGNSGTFKNNKIQRIILFYDGTYVTCTITDLADLPDTANPTVTISSTESGTTSINPIPLTFTLSEVSTDFVAGDVIVTNGTLQNFAGSGVDYTADLVPTADGAITVNIPADSFTDAAGNGNDAATPFNITYEEGAILLEEDFVGTTINASKFTVTNTNPAEVSISQNNELIFDCSQLSALGPDNKVESVQSFDGGAMSFRITSANNLTPASSAIGFFIDTGNRAIISPNTATGEVRLFVTAGGSSIYSLTTTGIFVNNKRFKIWISPTNDIEFYHWTTSWVQIGATQNADIGANKRFVTYAGGNPANPSGARLKIDDLYVDSTNFTTETP